MRAVVDEGDVRGTRGLDEVEVGDLVPGLQRRLRQELLGRVQPVDVVGDGVGGPMMGNRAVVLPEAVDQIVGELRDRGDRLLRCRRRHYWTFRQKPPAGNCRRHPSSAACRGHLVRGVIIVWNGAPIAPRSSRRWRAPPLVRQPVTLLHRPGHSRAGRRESGRTGTPGSRLIDAGLSDANLWFQTRSDLNESATVTRTNQTHNAVRRA